MPGFGNNTYRKPKIVGFHVCNTAILDYPAGINYFNCSIICKGRFLMARVKNVEVFCPNCNSITKMELTGEVSGSEQETKRWAKCKKCKQTMVIDLSEDVKETKVSLEGIENENCTVYSPKKSYSIGESIYHENWDDFGKVVAKDVLSNGQSSIAVEFQKSGLKKLIESLSI